MKFASTNKTKPNLLYNPTKRLSAVLLLMVFLFCAVLCKTFFVMVVDSKNLQVKALSQWLRDVPTDAPRGSILDKNGKVLASTSTRYNLYVRPSDTSDKEGVARVLCDTFGYDFETTLQKSQSARAKSRLQRKSPRKNLPKCTQADLTEFIIPRTIFAIIRTEIL